jgi:peptidoglycan/LPS O-acetylase OafA/YrhL
VTLTDLDRVPRPAPVTAPRPAPVQPAGRPKSPDGAPPGRVGYLPGLDGLRAVSVVAVLLYHAGLTWIPGGFLGVEVFFVISGYLITSLLLVEHATRGTISLRRFWQRRARRLLPAAYLVLASVALLVATAFRDEAAQLRGQLLAALAYASNWYLVVVEASYFAADGRPSPLQHLWSLAIEEQFYLVWPLVVLGLLRVFGRRRWPLALIVAGGVAASAAAMALLYRPALDPSRIYYGTDTRAQGLLLGALLALVWRPGRARRERVAPAPRVLELAGLLGLAGLVAAFLVVHDHEARLYRGGFAVVGLLSVLAIAACVHPGSWLGRRALGWGPLVWLGTRSYGLYLWHWPIFVFTRPGVDLPWGTLPVLGLRLALTAAAAEVSYRLVEAPIRGGAIGRWCAVLRSPDPARRRLRWRGVKVVTGAAVAVLAPVGVSLTVASAPLSEVERAVREGAEALPAAETPSEPVAQLAKAEATADAPSGAAPAARPGAPIDPAGLENRNVTVLADSVLLGAKGSVVKELGAGGWNVDYRGKPAWMLHKAKAELAAAREPVGSVVIVGLGYNSLWERNRARFDSWAEKFDREADALVAVLRELGAQRIVWVMVREPTLDVLPPEGLVGYNKYAWFFPYVNERLRELRARQPDVVLVDWAAVSNKRGITYDAIHLTSAGVRLMIDTIRSTTGL